MKLKFLFFFVGISLFFSALNAQQDQKCLLWEISGNGLDEPSYIFGTIHIIPTEDFFFFDDWSEKFLSCKNLVLETDIDLSIVKQISLIKKMKLPKDSTLADYMTKNEFLAFQSYMFDSLKISSSRYTITLNYKPFFSYSLLLDEVIPGDKSYYEKYLSDLAKDNRMKVYGLETIDFQMGLVDDISIKEQIPMFLFDYSKTEQVDFKSDYLKTLKLYKKQDLDAIAAIDDATTDDSVFNQEFLVKRNLKWIPLIESYITKKPTFIAVGAAHLPGENGVLKLLRDKGYTIKPVCSSKN